MSILHKLIAFFAPDECVGCRREGQLLCPTCAESLPPVQGVCFSCYMTVLGTVACKECLLSGDLRVVTAASDYSGLSKVLVAKLKFQSNHSAAKVMAERMLLSVDKSIRYTQVIHVPATTGHIRQRGYDQADLLARGIALGLDVPHSSLLRRTGQSHQLGSSRSQRLKQMADLVTVKDSKRLQGAVVLLVDDVLTTGASLDAAARKLRLAGADRVDAIVFAQSVTSKTSRGNK